MMMSGVRWTVRITFSVARTRAWPSQTLHRLRVYKVLFCRTNCQPDHCSHFHLPPSNRDHRHQLLHLRQAGHEGDCQGGGGVCWLQIGDQGAPGSGLQRRQE